MKNINEVYVDTLTGYLHVTLNELFNVKANLIVMEDDLQSLVRTIQESKSKENEYLTTITEQIEKIRELESIKETLKKENDSRAAEYSKTITLQNKVNELTQRITELKTVNHNTNEELIKLAENISALSFENDTLKKEIELLKTPSVQPKKIKK